MSEIKSNEKESNPDSKIKCYLTTEVYNKLKYYVDGVNSEISGVGKSEIKEDGNIYITDVIIFKQTCTGATTKISDEDQAKWMYEMTKRGESLKDWNVWWHSHYNFSVFWSGTDTATIWSHANGGGFLVSLVTNQKRDFRVRLDLFPKDVSPLRSQYSVLYKDNIPVETLMTAEEEAQYVTLKESIKEDELATNALLKPLTDQITQIHKEFKKRNKLTLEKIEELESSEIQDNKDLEKKIKEEIKEKVAGNYYLPTYQYGQYGQTKLNYGRGNYYDNYDYDDTPVYLTGKKKENLDEKDELTDEEKEINDEIHWKLDDIKNSSLYDTESDYVVDDDEDLVSENFNDVNNYLADERETIVRGFH